MKLPVYQLVISEDPSNELQVDAVALVDKPAIEKNFLAFKEKQLFSINEDRQIISGPAMISDTPIYRNNQEYGEHYVVFSKEQIGIIAQKFLNNGFTKSFNILHDPKMSVDSVSVLNSFVTDKEMGINPMAGFEDVPDGSWFLSAKISDAELWSKVKDGTLKGFSVEGYFKYQLPADPVNEFLTELETNLKSILTSISQE